jgi:hypothetical protein
VSHSFHFLSARYQAKVFTSDNVLLEVKELAYVNVPDAHLALARPCVAAAWSRSNWRSPRAVEAIPADDTQPQHCVSRGVCRNGVIIRILVRAQARNAAKNRSN